MAKFVSNAEREWRQAEYPWIVECKLIPTGAASTMLSIHDASLLLEKYKDWTFLRIPAKRHFKTIESAWRAAKHHGIMWEDYHYRLRNRVTDETIPFELFNG